MTPDIVTRLRRELEERTRYVRDRAMSGDWND